MSSSSSLTVSKTQFYSHAFHNIIYIIWIGLMSRIWIWQNKIDYQMFLCISSATSEWCDLAVPMLSSSSLTVSKTQFYSHAFHNMLYIIRSRLMSRIWIWQNKIDYQMFLCISLATSEWCNLAVPMLSSLSLTVSKTQFYSHAFHNMLYIIWSRLMSRIWIWQN